MKRAGTWLVVGLALVCAPLVRCAQRQQGVGEGAEEGAVKVATPGITVTVPRPTGALVLTTESGEIALPAGTYRSVEVRAIAKETVEGPDGATREATWLVQSGANTFRVKAGEATVLDFGPPFTVKATVDRVPGTVQIGYALVGKAGEQYGAQVFRDGAVRPAPKLTIVDEKGNTLVKAQLEYG